MSDDRERSALYSPHNEHPPVLPQWAGRHSRSRSSSSIQSQSKSYIRRTWTTIQRTRKSIHKQFRKLSLVQQIVVSIVVVFFLVVVNLGLIYHERLFHWLTPVAAKWRNLKAGWLIIFFWCFISAFPPMIGYSSCVTVAGFVYGFPHGWFVVAAGTAIGSTTAFLACRLYFQSFTQRLIAHDKRFAALSLTLKHDGLKLLCMIRLCPLPYSMGNGAMSTFPTVSPWSFAAATAISTPKLFIQVFVGSRMALLGESGEKMDGKTKAINYASIVFGIVLGGLTGYLIYARTQKRAQQLEAEERAHAREATPVETNVGDMFMDDPDAEVVHAAEHTLSNEYEEESDDGHGDDAPGSQNLGKKALGVLGGIFGRRQERNYHDINNRDSFDSDAEEEDAGRLLDGDEDDGDEDAEELLVVDHDTLELEESGRKSQDSKRAKRNSTGSFGSGGKRGSRDSSDLLR